MMKALTRVLGDSYLNSDHRAPLYEGLRGFAGATFILLALGVCRHNAHAAIAFDNAASGHVNPGDDPHLQPYRLDHRNLPDPVREREGISQHVGEQRGLPRHHPYAHLRLFAAGRWDDRCSTRDAFVRGEKVQGGQSRCLLIGGCFLIESALNLWTLVKISALSSASVQEFLPSPQIS